jgi:hypothetical protein
MRCKHLVMLSVAFAFSATNASAQNTIAASFSWTSTQLTQLKFSPAKYRQPNVGLVFSDPRKQDQIQKIMFDPNFKPSRELPDGHGGQMGYFDFFAQTSIKSPASDRKISETADCNWNDDKSMATCVIEDDGGRFQIEAQRNTTGAQKTALTFVLRQIDDYKSFVVAEYDTPQGPNRIEVDLVKPDSIISSPIKF